MELHAVVLAGGRGERFWPLSRNHHPKQLLRLLAEETLLEATLRRVSFGLPASQVWIVAGADLRPAFERLGLPAPPAQILWEPVARNTAAAIGAAAELLLSRGGGELLILPSDHWVSDSEAFWETVEAGRAILAQRDGLLTIGVPPAYPETGYGYIERGDLIDRERRAWRVALFHEKPDAERAARYVAGGCCFWNSGMFLFRAETIAAELRRHLPEMAPVLDRLRAELRQGPDEEIWRRYFADSPSVSIDNGVLEKSDDVSVIEARFAWSDLGSWISLGDHLEPDAAGNRRRGPVLCQDSENSILVSEGGGLLAVLGVKGLIVVRVGDATLVCPKERAQEVRRLVQEGRASDVFKKYF